MKWTKTTTGALQCGRLAIVPVHEGDYSGFGVYLDDVRESVEDTIKAAKLAALEIAQDHAILGPEKVTVKIHPGDSVWIYSCGSLTSASGLVGIDADEDGGNSYRLGSYDPKSRLYEGQGYYNTIEAALEAGSDLDEAMRSDLNTTSGRRHR